MDRFTLDMLMSFAEREMLAERTRDKIAAIERQHVSLVDAHRTLSLFDPVWDVLLPRERARILGLLIEAVEYDGNQGEVALTFYPLGIGRVAAEAASAGAPAMEAPR